MWLSDAQRDALAEFAKSKREAVGYTVTEAAREAGVSWQAIKKLEKGNTSLTSANGLSKLAQVYQCDADEFCRLAGFVPEDLHTALLEPGAIAKARKTLGRSRS